MLHDFYTGTERILERIASEIDGGVPGGPAWHRSLLQSATLDLPGLRPPVLRPESARALAEFLGFRHAFRNSYGFDIEWPRVHALLERVRPAWDLVEADLDVFLPFVDALGRG